MNLSEIYILYNEPVEGSGADDWDVLDEVAAVEKALAKLGIASHRMGINAGFMQQFEQLAAIKPSVIFNLVEAINNKGEINYFVPALLNMHRLTYSGNPLEALFITTSKRLTAEILQLKRIQVPRSFKPSNRHLLQQGRKYILKPVWEEGSAGITPDSVFVFDGNIPEKLANANDQHWQIEEFIEGREFNVSILAGKNGPDVLPLAEITFRNFEPDRPRIVDYHAKWTPGSFEYENTIRIFPDLSSQPQLNADLQKAAIDTWHALGMKGYARVDMRVSETGKVFVLEANANPCISPDSGFVAAAAMGGYSFTDVVERILSDLNEF